MKAAIESEICILGGAPAGSVIARRLAELGHDTVLIERTAAARPPRAESLAPSIVPILDSLQLRHDVDAAVFCRERRALVLWESGDIAVKSLDASPSLLVERALLDDRLRAAAARAAVRIIAPGRARKAERQSEGGWLIPVAASWGPALIKSRFLVDARGRRHHMGIDGGAPRTWPCRPNGRGAIRPTSRPESKPEPMHGSGEARCPTVPMRRRSFSIRGELPGSAAMPERTFIEPCFRARNS
jgi:flavin-dependent dehydrogenase